MDYAKLLKEYLKKPAVKSLTTEIVKFNQPGEVLLGKIVDIKPFHHSTGDKPCLQYIIDTVDGRKSFVLGARLDNELSESDLIDHILAVQFNGQIKLDNGRTCNLFNVNDLTDLDITELQEAEKEVIDGINNQKAGEGQAPKTDKQSQSDRTGN